MDIVYRDFLESFEQAPSLRTNGDRRIGAEFKFPIVNPEGTVAEYAKIDALWQYLAANGWSLEKDEVSGRVVGARKPGERNETVASCETGYCKVEFSLAHVGNLGDLEKQLDELIAQLRPFCDKERVRLLGYGIHPVVPPSRRLLMKKSRAGTWDRIQSTNRYIAPEDGHDMHLFTVNTASHCHVNVSVDEAAPLVNVLNGFAPAQLALTADSPVWKDEEDAEFRCVAEKFWDWWMPEGDRVGVIPRPFDDLRGYVDAIAQLRPVFVKRHGKPIILKQYDTFREFYESGRAVGEDPEGREVSFVPAKQDLDLHNTCYWYNARISRYYTVENRTNDQQPPDEMMTVPALTLGLASAAQEAREELAPYDWQALRRARDRACRHALRAPEQDGIDLAAMAARMVEIAKLGLTRRGLDEEVYLEPLESRLREGRSPADEACEAFRRGGAQGLVESRSI